MQKSSVTTSIPISQGSSERALPRFIAMAKRNLEYYTIGKIKRLMVHHRTLGILQRKTSEIEISNAKALKVVFIQIFSTMWKCHALYEKLSKDPRFEPIILICPCISYGTKALQEEMERSLNYFRSRQYNVISAWDDRRNIWRNITELSPDIVFFALPYRASLDQYFDFVLKNYVCCYVQYSHEASRFYKQERAQYDAVFHSAVWRIFAPHACSLENYNRNSSIKGKNVVVTGYPLMEGLYPTISDEHVTNSSWVNSDKRKRIIFAPHHSIFGDVLNYATFLWCAEAIRSLANQYKDLIFWCFKPHPELKYKLYRHKDWGQKRTDAYYASWDNVDIGQVCEGEYLNLFVHSDAMIHDCGSFLAEYLYLKKPVLYLRNDVTDISYYNEFGQEALQACRIGQDIRDIRTFIECVANGVMGVTSNHHEFLHRQIEPFFLNTTPSARIISEIGRCFYGNKFE